MSNSARADLNRPGMEALELMPEPQRSYALAVHAVIMELEPGAVCLVKWGNACYFRGARGFATIYATKRGVNLGMPAAGLADPEGLLEGTGKRMRHIKVMNGERARSPALRALIAAVLASEWACW